MMLWNWNWIKNNFEKEMLMNCEKILLPEIIKNKILDKTGMEKGNVIISMGRSSALENVAKIVYGINKKGLIFFDGCYYGNTCLASQVGGHGRICHSCEAFEVLTLENVIILEKGIEKYSTIMGAAVVQPYTEYGKVGETVLKILRGSCTENGLLLIDDETMSGPSETGKWMNIDLPVDMVILGSDLVSDIYPVEALVVNHNIPVRISQELIHPLIYSKISDSLGRDYGEKK